MLPEQCLCSVTVDSGEPFAVADARAHARVRDLPPVTEGGVCSYLGAPIFSTDGLALGAICAFGPDVRAWSVGEMEAMVELAELVGHEIRRLTDVDAADQLRQAPAALLRAAWERDGRFGPEGWSELAPYAAPDV